jgi:excinuclease UvrABC helicase subunit UvrB
MIDQRQMLRQLAELQYQRNEIELPAVPTGCAAT